MDNELRNIRLDSTTAETSEGGKKFEEVEKAPEKEFDPIEATVNGVGRWQILICLVIALLKIPVAFHQLGILFLAPPATFECSSNSDLKTGQCSANCTSYIFNKTVFQNTIVMDWELVCDRDWMKNMTQTIFMFGVLLGNMLFGFLSDRYGRRNPLLVAVFFQAVAGIAASFATDWYTFTAIRFLLALATGGTMITGFVLTMEMVGVKYRQLFSMIFQIPFNIGHAIMVGIAYATTNSWSSYQLWVSIPTVALLAYYWIIPESPRWLLAIGKTDEATEILFTGAKMNGLPTDSIASTIKEHQKLTGKADQKKETVVGLFRTPNMRRKTLFLCFSWLSCGICFFGVSQYVGQLSGNIFTNVLISALIQIPGTIVVIFLNDYFGRKKTLIGAYLLSAIPLIGISIIPESWVTCRVVFSLIGVLGMSLSFPTIYLFAGELFPTVLRNTGMGLCSVLARCGSMIAPFIAGLDIVKYWIPPVIFGGMPMIAAILTLFLPETHRKELPTTLEEAENFGKIKAEKSMIEGHAS